MCGGTKRGGFQTDLLQINRFFMLEQHGSTAFTAYACRVLMLLGDVEDPYRRLVGSRYQGRLDQSQTMWLSKIRCFFKFFFFLFESVMCSASFPNAVCMILPTCRCLCFHVSDVFRNTHTHTRTLDFLTQTQRCNSSVGA